MPTSTSTFSLNISAIRALCAGSTVRSGSAAPLSSFGDINDFYIDSTAWYIYGPKSTTLFWQNSTSIIGPSGVAGSSSGDSLFREVSGFLFNNTTAGFFTASALGIYNTTETGLFVSSAGFPCALFSTNNDNVATMYSNGAPLFICSKANTSLSANSVDIGGNVSFSDNVSIPLGVTDTFNVSDNLLVSAGRVVFGTSCVDSLTSAQTVPALSSYGVSSVSNTIVAAKLFTVAYPTDNTVGLIVYNDSTTTKAMFKTNLAGSLNILSNPYDFTIAGTVSSSADIRALTYSDKNGNRLLTIRQTAPAKLTAGVSTSANIIDSFNTLIDRLTAHGLIF